MPPGGAEGPIGQAGVAQRLGVHLSQPVAGDRLVRQWLIQAAKEYGITATIEGSLDLKLNLTQMADGYSGQEHSLPIMPIYFYTSNFIMDDSIKGYAVENAMENWYAKDMYKVAE